MLKGDRKFGGRGDNSRKERSNHPQIHGKAAGAASTSPHNPQERGACGSVLLAEFDS